MAVIHGSPRTTARRVSAWFEAHARDLPWRRVHDPYHTLLVEFLLQQTRVETGLRYYEAFVRRFPTLQDLAAAQDTEVLRMWSGLGYYRRARNLHATVRAIVRDHGGFVPADPTVLEALPGIGPYTAGAVASIAYDRPAPAIDGNQARVIGRVLGLASTSPTGARKRVEAWARRLLASGSPRTLNQALMDIGGSVCRPRAPLCASCPLAPECRSRDRIRDRPSTKGPRMVEHWTARLHVRDGRLWLAVPREQGLLAHLWLPPLERAARPHARADATHVFSHKAWRVRFVRTRSEPAGEGRWVRASELAGLPHGSLTRRAFDAAFGPRPARPKRGAGVGAPWALPFRVP